MRIYVCVYVQCESILKLLAHQGTFPDAFIRGQLYTLLLINVYFSKDK